MATFFFDSSGLVKYFIKEVGTTWVHSLLDPPATNEIVVAQVTGVEIISRNHSPGSHWTDFCYGRSTSLHSFSSRLSIAL